METVERERQPAPQGLAAWKEGLNLFFRRAAEQGRGRDGTGMDDVPSLCQADLGRTEWEQQLIRRLGSLHHSWRTEQTYRSWAWRFAKFLALRPVESASEAEVREFLSGLATEQRVSAATQKQPFVPVES